MSMNKTPIMTRFHGVIPATLVLALMLATTRGRADEPSRPPDGYDRLVKPFFGQYCSKCHGEKKPKGGLRLDALGSDFATPASATHWTDIMDRINAGEMPPEGSPRPKPDEAAKVAEWIAAQLTEADASRNAGLGEKVSFRRLTREEYRNTIRDLLGVTCDVNDPGGLPEDPDWQGVERVGSVLTLSPSHVEKYLSTAEAALAEALPTGPKPPREVIHWSPFDLRWGYAWNAVARDYIAQDSPTRSASTSCRTMARPARPARARCSRSIRPANTTSA